MLSETDRVSVHMSSILGSDLAVSRYCLRKYSYCKEGQLVERRMKHGRSDEQHCPSQLQR